ncbi:MAG: type 1 glutamine amidotransferase domain-containing protein [Thalassobaculum sp.]
MPTITTAKIAILATHGFEKSELFEPKRRLEEAGASVTVVSPEAGPIKSWDKSDWGETIPVDIDVADARVDDFDALVLPGGQINPDILRTDPDAVALVRAFFDSGKTVAAICHGPWMLVEADVVKGRAVTSYHSIQTDVKNAGGLWQDSGGRRRPGPHHLPEAGRPRGLLRQDHRGDRGRPPRPPRRLTWRPDRGSRFA